MHSVDAFRQVNAFLGRPFSTDQHTVEEHKTYGEHREGRQHNKFDRIVVAIGDLLAVPEPTVIDSVLEHLPKKIPMGQVEIEVDAGTLSEHDKIVFFGRVWVRAKVRGGTPGRQKSAFLTVVRMLLILSEHFAFFGQYEYREFIGQRGRFVWIQL